VAWGIEEPLAVAAPPGAARVVQIALNQVGKPYIWGAKGPAAFDCSGLMTWAYGQIGIRIPHGTAGQWPGLPAVDRSAIQPGDLIYFAIGGGRVDHVGMLVGDLNGDGRWDMVHAASPALGVRVDYGVFESAYYQPKIVGLRTAR
jgi:cell wall-associated NlpC family hydrolase